MVNGLHGHLQPVPGEALALRGDHVELLIHPLADGLVLPVGILGIVVAELVEKVLHVHGRR